MPQAQKHSPRALWGVGSTLLFIALSASATAPWDPDEVTLVKRELAEGVYAVLPDDVDERDHVATTGGFVVGDRGVLLIETMLNERLYRQMTALVREVTDKPIRWAVNTSYHGDHSYGNYLLPAKTMVIQHHATKRYVDANFKQDKKFMLDLMGPDKGIEPVRPRSADLAVGDYTVLDLGNRNVELRHFGFAQTEGDLTVWLPEAEVLWVGNMLQAPPPALTWLLEGGHRDAIATLGRVQQFLPADATVIPGHGRPAKPAMIEFQLGYLRELEAAVREAIDHGLSLEEAKKAADMPKYADYSLYGWVHPEVNVPAVYQELTDRE